ncbi:MAG: putative lipid II flippase FtsW [Clostridia bacterium]|nr:putative lipid II flippase FtsW [Clostridia bacterium]
MPPKNAKRASVKKEHKKEHAVIKKTSADLGFLAVVILLTVLGLIMVFSASYPSANYKYGDGLYFIRKQALWAVIGFAAMIVTMKIDYRLYKKNALWILLVTVVLLLLVLASTPIKGSRRWLGFGSISFQPSEAAKLAVIIYFAASLSVVKERIREFKVLLRYGVILMLVLGLLLLEPHFSVCLIIGAVAFIMLMVAGAQWKHFGMIALVAIPIVIVVATKADYRMDRLAMYWDPFVDPQGDGWQIIQSLYAIGSGGLFGLGFGNSRQKYMYVSEPQNDFIFSIVCEELGMIGAFVIIILFGVLIWRGIKIAINAPDTFGSLLVTGIVSLVGVQTFFNIAVVTKLVPTTGVSLPFFSAGGSSLVFLMAAMGMVLNVSKFEKQVVDLR